MLAGPQLGLGRAALDIVREKAAKKHAVVLPVIGYEVYGKALLGRDDHITPLV